MSSWLIILTGVIYAYIAIEQLFKGSIGMACTYAGYAFANVGLYMMAIKWVLPFIRMMAWKLFNGFLLRMS